MINQAQIIQQEMTWYNIWKLGLVTYMDIWGYMHLLSFTLSKLKNIGRLVLVKYNLRDQTEILNLYIKFKNIPTNSLKTN